MTHVDVYQGNQIGGCVTVITCENDYQIKRIMIDYGASLPGSKVLNEFDYPWKEKPVEAVFFTHYHGDHIGRILEIPEDIPLYMGDTTRKVLINIREALAARCKENAAVFKKELELLKDDSRVRTFGRNKNGYKVIEDISGFRIEPYCIDHSAYDAYMFVIESQNNAKESGYDVILHTGDFRGHGRRGKALLSIIEKYVHRFGKRNVDTVVVEGTMMSRSGEKVMTEYEMQLEAARYLKEHKYVFLICSSTNLDSLASFYQAGQMAAYPKKRYLYTYNEYYRTQLKTFSETAGAFSEIYQFRNIHKLDLEKKLVSKKWDKPKSQKELMEKHGFIAIIKPEPFCEKYINAFVKAYEEGIIKQKPVIIYSMWDGYVEQTNKARNEVWIRLLKKQEERGIRIKHLHTSGHATTQMLAEFIDKVNPLEEIIPIHTECVEAFDKLPVREELKEKIRMH